MDKFFDLQPRKIAIFRALQLGDLLCSIPAIRALKQTYPYSAITLLGLPWAQDFVRRFSCYFNNFIHFPGYPGIVEQPFKVNTFIDFLKEVNKHQFDLVIQMHGNGSLINPMIQMLGAKRTAGFYEYGRYCPDPDFYLPYSDELPEIERHIRLMNYFGIPSQGTQMEFPFEDSDYSSFRKIMDNYHLKPKKYVCVHSGARDVKRWWEPEKFAKVADRIAEKGYTIVLTGTDAERATVKQVEQKMVHPALNLVGRTNLGALALIIKNSRMLFSNDTGVSHIASSLDTPSVIVFLVSDPKRWAPLNQALHKIILPQEATNVDLVISKVEEILRFEEVGV